MDYDLSQFPFILSPRPPHDALDSSNPIIPRSLRPLGVGLVDTTEGKSVSELADLVRQVSLKSFKNLY